MSDNLVQRLSDKLTIRDIDVLRLAAYDEARIEAEITSLAEELLRRLIRSDPNAVGPLAGQERLDDVIAASRGIIREVYQALYGDFRNQLMDVMVNEQNVVRGAVAESLGVSARTAALLLGANVDRSTRREIIDNRVISANADDAERLRGFFEREAGSLHQRYAGTLQEAFKQDETISQMQARLKAVTEISARETAAIIRTGYNHAVSQLRIEMMQRNSALFRGVIWISRLDSRTTIICASRSNGMWDLNTGRPLPDSPVQARFPGAPPAHFSCRSQLHPLTRSATDVFMRGGDEVQEAISSLTDEQRRLLSTDPPAVETYTEWLKRQSEAVQKRVLGATRRDLWLQGKVQLTDLVTQKGRPLTLKQLNRRLAS